MLPILLLNFTSIFLILGVIFGNNFWWLFMRSLSGLSLKFLLALKHQLILLIIVRKYLIYNHRIYHFRSSLAIPEYFEFDFRYWNKVIWSFYWDVFNNLEYRTQTLNNLVVVSELCMDIAKFYFKSRVKANQPITVSPLFQEFWQQFYSKHDIVACA